MSHPKPETARLTADVVLLGTNAADSTSDAGETHVLLIKRRHRPFQGCWALPGGHVDEDEEVLAAAHRELEEETGLTAANLRLVGVYSTVGRDPRGRYVTWAYAADVDGLPAPVAKDDAAEAAWKPVRGLLSGEEPLAFDHARILRDALGA